ncbi:MAG: hypothetical protein JJU29_21680, partial [Verrucomicrobia bacterium]|nr:hypothetical protein [Verrucomicrobiota bacterium]
RQSLRHPRDKHGGGKLPLVKDSGTESSLPRGKHGGGVKNDIPFILVTIHQAALFSGFSFGKPVFTTFNHSLEAK